VRTVTTGIVLVGGGSAGVTLMATGSLRMIVGAKPLPNQ
jgi:hypothetical protein